MNEPEGLNTVSVYFRTGRGRWKLLGTATTVRAALALVNCRGDWWLRTGVPAAEAVTPGLFDDVVEAAAVLTGSST